jgi:hypothetical protein
MRGGRGTLTRLAAKLAALPKLAALAKLAENAGLATSVNVPSASAASACRAEIADR